MTGKPFTNGLWPRLSRRRFMQTTAAASIAGFALAPTVVGAAAATEMPDTPKPIDSGSTLITRYTADSQALQALAPEGLTVYRDMAILTWSKQKLVDDTIPPFTMAGLFCYVQDASGRKGSTALAVWTDGGPAVVAHLQAMYGDEVMQAGTPAFETDSENVKAATVHAPNGDAIISLTGPFQGPPGPWLHASPDGTWTSNSFAAFLDNGQRINVMRRHQRVFYDAQEIDPLETETELGDSASIFKSIGIDYVHNGWSVRVRDYYISAPEGAD